MLRSFTLRIVLPTFLCAALFAFALFLVVLPAFEKSILERKREMIRELTTSAWNILASLDAQVQQGQITREQAQASAVTQIRALHYGMEMKDYFWINDMHPRMVVHPYRHDLNGQDLTDFRDPTGKRVFVEMVELVAARGAGFVEYHWQWKDDSSHVVPKLSYVKGFTPWGWVLGTGVYLDDVHREIQQITRRLVAWSLAILATVSLLLFFIARQSWQTERQRVKAELALRDSEARYRTLVESAGESILMALGDDRLYANAKALDMLGYDAGDLTHLRLSDLLPHPPADLTAPAAATQRHETVLRRRDGSELHALISLSPITVGDKTGVILVATDITQRKAAEHALTQSEAKLRVEAEELRSQEARHQSAIEDLRLTLAMLQPTLAGSDDFRLLDDLRQAGSVAEVVQRNAALPRIVRALCEQGAKPGLINRLITLDADAVLNSLVRLNLAELGPPPAPFVFLIMGSEGRREQTLKTDQDNALLFADPPADQLPAAQAYFQTLAGRVCGQLNDAGYAFCEGGVMASNPRWCLSLSAWQRTFSDWVQTLEAQDLLQAKIFFDFRAGAGDEALAAALRQSLTADLARHPRFFAQLARNVLLFTPPIGVFGQFHLEPAPDGRKALNIKSAMMPIVDFARLYALRHGVVATNTTLRLEALRDAGVLPPQQTQEILEVYAALMHIRLTHQVRRLSEHATPDNFIEPSHLSYLDQRLLKDSFHQIRHFQTRLAYDFTGLPEVPA